MFNPYKQELNVGNEGTEMKQTSELKEKLLEEFLTELGVEPDGKKIWATNTSEIKEVLEPLLSQYEADIRDDAENKEAEYYSKKYIYERNREFHNFLKILHTVLIDKTSPGLISAILEDCIEEYNKFSQPNTKEDK